MLASGSGSRARVIPSSLEGVPRSRDAAGSALPKTLSTMARVRSAAALIAALAWRCAARPARALPPARSWPARFLLRSDEAVVHTSRARPRSPGARFAARAATSSSSRPARTFSDNALGLVDLGTHHPGSLGSDLAPVDHRQPYSLYAHVRAVTSKGPTALERTVRLQHALACRSAAGRPEPIRASCAGRRARARPATRSGCRIPWTRRSASSSGRARTWPTSASTTPSTRTHPGRERSVWRVRADAKH